MVASTTLSGAAPRADLERAGFGVATGQSPPVRLSSETRALAARYLAGAVGRTVLPAPAALARDATGMSANRCYAEAVLTIAQEAPLRLGVEERLVGAATFREAMAHRMPLTPFPSISHTTLDFEKALRLGYAGLRAELHARLERGGLDAEGRELLEAMLLCIRAAGLWQQRYVEALEARRHTGPAHARRFTAASLDVLRRVPEHPPATFHEAVQALWFFWEFQRLCGNWSGVGRIDKMLGPFLDRDLAAGRIELDEARELLAHFWIKGCEWITAEGRGTGDAQFYQNIVLAGVDEAGAPVCNAVTDLVLDVVEELHISDFPIAVRLSAQSPERLLRRIAAIQRLGGGIVAVYNDDRIIPNLVAFGYPLAEARNYANDGCWEILIPGKTAFGYQPFDALLLLQEVLGLSAAAPAARHEKAECSEWVAQSRALARPRDCPDFETLYSAFRERLRAEVDGLMDQVPWSDVPCPLLSLLVDGCIERGRSYLQGGARYTVRSPHAGGLPDVANSLLVIRRLVFAEKRYALADFVRILQDDWAGQEPLRREVQARFDFYGNDNAEADALLQRVFNDYTDAVGRERERHGVLRPAGISTFGRETAQFREHRSAAASGQKKGAVLAANFSPSPGTDRRGPTAVIRSHCSVDFSRLPCGTALDLKVLPASVQGDAGLLALAGLLRTFVSLGGIFLQIDVVDTALLRAAQAHPEKYPNLAVRISGWSARFATLSTAWQEMIIARTEQRV